MAIPCGGVGFKIVKGLEYVGSQPRWQDVGYGFWRETIEGERQFSLGGKVEQTWNTAIQLGEARYSSQARFRDLPTVDMKEILQQRMFEDDPYKANNVYNDLYEALKKSLELDYSNQHLAEQEEARKKRRKRRDAPRSPPGSPPSQPPPLPPQAGTSGTPGTSRASRYDSSGIVEAQELSPSDDLMHDDSALDEQVQVSDDQDSGDDHTPAAAASRKD
ncbi:hypothetical protein Tco_1425865 [Tanacetum coccineum]